MALTLIRTGTIQSNDFIGTQVYSFADGSTAKSDVFILHEIKIGNYLIKNVTASISNSINAPMLLGQSVLQRLGKFSVDNNNHTLIIEWLKIAFNNISIEDSNIYVNYPRIFLLF